MKNGIIFSMLLCLILACAKKEGSKILSPQQFKNQIVNETETYQILDLRTDEEVAQGMVPTAEQLDYLEEKFDAKLKKLDKNKTYYIYCRSGNRSGKAMALMTELGFEKVYDMQGGMQAWESAGMEIEMPK
ncbi:rhodanese-like domain-containing protein [Reichenbachiella carrageenanivorans]|uniref:Rhodanese-like domain-containing protein n=1 Tax=Reichenbachiella carrageenanivorans TaxID=2979869 RepID=A0ABY6CZD0_9BACT|nr:rhodanese-like domain-containing protein [Reichenbachiella carrageenanivorans]UXX78178.1 rhodanese-like domain-containing protein [Reichenbachiella carrageenanivorans]